MEFQNYKFGVVLGIFCFISACVTTSKLYYGERLSSERHSIVKADRNPQLVWRVLSIDVDNKYMAGRSTIPELSGTELYLLPGKYRLSIYCVSKLDSIFIGDSGTAELIVSLKAGYTYYISCYNTAKSLNAHIQSIEKTI